MKREVDSLDRQLADDGVPAIVTLREAADLARRDARTIQRHINEGLLRRLPSHAKGSPIRISRRALAAYLSGEYGVAASS